MRQRVRIAGNACTRIIRRTSGPAVQSHARATHVLPLHPERGADIGPV